MTMATETENNAPEGKDMKDVKEMKEALKDENKQQEDNKQEDKDGPKKEESGKKEDSADAGGGGAAGGQAQPASSAPAAKAVNVHKTNYEKDVVYLYQFSRTPLLPSLSPYCLKVETWLRLNAIKYEVSVLRNP